MFSIIIPLYNKAHTIVNTLQTVFNQTFKDFEIIIINDGSTDNGVEIIKNNFNDPRIKIINQENAGVSAARNRGVKEAKAEWIAFLDGDDEWLPLYLETIYNTIKEYPEAKYIGCASFSKNLVNNKISAHAIIDKYINKVECINYFMNPDRMTHIGASVLLKDVFVDAGGFDPHLRINEDLLLLGKVGIQNNLYYIGKALHVYVGGVPGQATNIKTRKKEDAKNKLDVINQLYECYLLNNRTNKLVPIALKYRFRHSLLSYLKVKDYRLIKYSIDNLHLDLKKQLVFLRWFKYPSFNKLCIAYIYYTKIIWRLHGFPRVGQKSKYNDELINEYRKER